jgi:hypothetical protein
LLPIVTPDGFVHPAHGAFRPRDQLSFSIRLAPRFRDAQQGAVSAGFGAEDAGFMEDCHSGVGAGLRQCDTHLARFGNVAERRHAGVARPNQGSPEPALLGDMNGGNRRSVEGTPGTHALENLP